VSLRTWLRRWTRDPLLDADYVESYQRGPKVRRRFSPGRYLRIAGVEKDAIPWPPAGGASRGASTNVTGTRWRG
jgi:hypothetical protein